MKKNLSYYLLAAVATLLAASCGQRRVEAEDSLGFVDVPQDSVFIDLGEYSDIWLGDVESYSGAYYLAFSVKDERGFTSSRLVELNEESLLPRLMKQPDKDWIPCKYDESESELIVSTDRWEVFRSNCGEFGCMTWFIDRNTKDEYAIGEMYGDLRAAGGRIYHIDSYKITEIDDPTLGAHCDSVLSHENSKDIRFIAAHFFHHDAYRSCDIFQPLVQFDCEHAKTGIIGSFVASDTLFCTINTPDGFELAKLEDGHLTTVHSFHNPLWSYSKYYRPDENRCVRIKAKDDRQLLMVHDKDKGYAELYDVRHDGNRLFALQYK